LYEVINIRVDLFCIIVKFNLTENCQIMKKTLRSLIAASLAVFSVMTANAQATPPASKTKSKVSQDLLELAKPTMKVKAAGPLVQNPMFIVSKGKVVIDAVSIDENGEKLLGELNKLGLEYGSFYGKVVSGFFPIDKIEKLESISSVKMVRAAYTPQKSVGATTSQAYQSLKADVAKNNYGVTGKGSKIGVLSDSYNSLGGAPAGVASGDLPKDVEVLQDLPAEEGSDEGRAMAELVHDVAPGAKIAFHTAFNGQAGFANGILKLANKGCNIIVDDVIYFAEPFFQDGIIAQAVNHVAGKNISYFSSAGNNANTSYEAKFKNSKTIIPGLGEAHDFGGGDITQKFTIAPFGSFRVILQWDDPFFSVSGGAGAQTDLDLVVKFNGQIAFVSASNNLGSDPVEGIFLENDNEQPADVEIVITKFTGPDPKYIKWIHYGNGDIPNFIEHDTKSSTVIGHANALGALAVGAAPYFTAPVFNPGGKPEAEYFSSLGGTPVFISEKGINTGFAEWKRRLKPQITAVDATNTTFFGFDIEGDGFPNFFGTSAAAPHAAAVAALMQEGNKTRLSPLVVASVMALSAIDMDNSFTPKFDVGFDLLTGFGLIQADKCVKLTRFSGSAVESVEAPTPLITSIDATQKVQLDAYPNPSKGNVTISTIGGKSSGNTEVSITNSLGQRVTAFTIPQGTLQKQVNLSKYGKGFYIISLTSNGETTTKKILVN
jgi:hypothetical protein